MQNRHNMPITTTISPKLFEWAKENNITFAKLLRYGYVHCVDNGIKHGILTNEKDMEAQLKIFEERAMTLQTENLKLEKELYEIRSKLK